MMTNVQPKLNIPLTPSVRMTNVLIVLLNIAVWGTCVYIFCVSPDRIPIHYDFHGTPDRYGSKVFVFLAPVIGTTLSIILYTLNQYPHRFNYLVKITEDNALDQYQRAQWIIRILNIAIIVMVGAVTISSYLAKNQKLGIGFILTEVFFLFVFPLFAIIYSTRKKKKV